MPTYIPQLLQRLLHPTPSRPQYSPHDYIPVKYSSKGDHQYIQKPDTTAHLDKKGIKYVQSAIGGLLYYARALDNTILPALNQLSTEQALPTITTEKNSIVYSIMLPRIHMLSYAFTLPTCF